MTSPPSRPDPRSGDRIAKLLARAGIASRREVERMIAEGRVKLGDTVIDTPNTVLESLRGVSVDGKPVKAAQPPRIFVFHKPSGLITAERDPAGRPTIYTALRNALPADTPRLMPIGRLDLNTEGLLLLTNDGELKRAMELPSSGIPRTYRARTFGDISQDQLEKLIEGVEIDGIRYGKIDANMERRTGRNQWIELTITEGKNREVRRVLEHLGLQVSRLMRISYGPFQLLDLPRGAALEVRQVDVERFIRGLKGAPMPLQIAAQPRPAPARPAPARPASARPVSGQPTSGRPTRERPEAEARPRRAHGPGKAAPRRLREEDAGALHHSPREARRREDGGKPAPRRGANPRGTQPGGTVEGRSGERSGNGPGGRRGSGTGKPPAKGPPRSRSPRKGPRP